MRYTEIETTVLAGKLTPASTATIELVDMKNNVVIELLDNTCVESPLDGMYLWDTTNVELADDTHVLYCMTDSAGKKAYGKIVLGGDFASETNIVQNVVQGNEDLRAIIEDVQLGNWEILGTEMIMRTAAGAELARFSLYDKYGQPSGVNVFKRERV
ncbi:MAG: hypothetical protein DRP08_06865 [Candidatus Aenigmatarchaeota archaeon]|nr:MAG: hypothetical protein DRP08_06865 [Candidatus Aenigmarchaeota archaeon]